jgi:hypothetical protein
VLSWAQRYLGSWFAPIEQLQTSLSISSPSWEFATNVVIQTQDVFRVTIPADSPQQLFRLRIFDPW